MKLNNKGYLLVEIIVASVLAFVMMYFLIEITVKLKNINDDYYVETKLETDQILMVRDVMSDLSSNLLKEISVSENVVNFTFIDNSNNEFKSKITIDTSSNPKLFKYGKVNDSDEYEDDVYVKSFDENLNVSDAIIENLCYVDDNYINCNELEDVSNVNKGLLNINIPAVTMYSDVDYGVKLVIPYSYKIDICISDPIGDVDESGANVPDVSNGLIPVRYNECQESWVKADTTSGWYNYSEKKWANAVLVSETNRETYKNAVVGTSIPEEDVLAYYVWIPRYKYKVWNINKEVTTEENYGYKAYTEGIDIVFESGTDSTGTIECTYDFTVADGSLSETCTGSNGDYYTHPAFTFGDTEVEGIWVGKYEISSSVPNTSMGGGESTTLSVRIKPNVNSWRHNYIDNFNTVIQAMDDDDNEYGLATSESHMLKNIEWGAVAYLTHSNYGRCSEGECSEVAINSYYGEDDETGYKTGCGPQSEGSTDYGSICNEYNSELGQSASTTGNLYGIYDMNGGVSEYVMGNVSGTAETYIYYQSSANTDYSVDPYGEEYIAKYIDTYAYGTNWSDQEAFNRARLGDATTEVLFEVSSESGWYSDYSQFAYRPSNWFRRGGGYNAGANSGVFAFSSDMGSKANYISARAALIG